MKKEWLYAACLACLVAACSSAPQSVKEGVCSIDVAGAMEKPAELKLSELGKDVRYVSLETNDSCLIGKNPSILLLDEHIAVYTYKACYLFDKTNGKFLCEVGHGGDDPEAYSYAQPMYNDAEELLYFKREPNGLQKYDLQGKYQGKVNIGTPPAAPSDYVFTDSLIIGHHNNVAQQYNARSLTFFTHEGILADTISSLLPVLPEKKVGDIAEISVKRLGLAGILLTKFSDGNYSAGISGIPFLWKNKDKVRFKESFSDTIYTVERDKLAPAVVFATGKWHWGAEARTDSKDNESRLLLTAVFETEKNIFFQCVRGIYSNAPEAFNGIYDRQTGTTRVYEEKKGFADDLTGFLPFHPQSCSAQGEYGMIVGADKVLEWLEENPKGAQNEKMAALEMLTEDSNPVVVITIL